MTIFCFLFLLIMIYLRLEFYAWLIVGLKLQIVLHIGGESFITPTSTAMWSFDVLLFNGLLETGILKAIIISSNIFTCVSCNDKKCG